jgi:hypothetical protein
MNIGRIEVNCEGPGPVDGQTVYVVSVPSRADTFIYRYVAYRVIDVRHTPQIDGGDWLHSITIVLEHK